jgi:hypothetical protein
MAFLNKLLYLHRSLLMPCIHFYRDDHRDIGGLQTPAVRQWNEKLDQFKADKMECSTAILKASGLSK